MANQIYKTGASEEYIIVGNDALVKCNIPSFVTDLVSVVSWEDSEGTLIFENDEFGNLGMRPLDRKAEPTFDVGFASLSRLGLKLLLDSQF